MRPAIVVIENKPPSSPNANSDICKIFHGDYWIEIEYLQNGFKILDSDINCLNIMNSCSSGPIIHFYKKLMSNFPLNAIIFRVRNPAYPLIPLMGTEIQNNYPEDSYRYILSTGEECGLAGFFVERLSSSILDLLSSDKNPIMPPGYFNGMAYDGSGRHWFSLDLRRYYLKNCFEILFNSPRYIAVNAISKCNYQCLKCQYHSSIINKKDQHDEIISLDQYNAILKKCKEFPGLNSISLTISGEPLLHPQIVELVRMTRKSGYNCGFITNAALLTNDLAINLIKAGVKEIAFSVDSTKPDVYNHLQGGDLEAIERNILFFQKESIKRNGFFSGTMICVISSENVNEIEGYRQLWLNRGFSVVFSAQHDITDNFTPFFMHKKWSPSNEMPCFALWNGLYLMANGNIVTCGATAKGKGFEENFFTSEPKEIWRSPILQNFRDNFLEGNRPFFCHKCSCWTGQMSTWVYINDRLINHTQGSWMENPPVIKSKKNISFKLREGFFVLRKMWNKWKSV